MPTPEGVLTLGLGLLLQLPGAAHTQEAREHSVRGTERQFSRLTTNSIKTDRLASSLLLRQPHSSRRALPILRISPLRQTEGPGALCAEEFEETLSPAAQ